MLLTAPTGVAVYSVHAAAFHNSLAIGTDVSLPHQPLGDKKVNSDKVARVGPSQSFLREDAPWQNWGLNPEPLNCQAIGPLRV